MVTKVPHMSTGNQETSYANSSATQKNVILKTRPILEDALKKLHDDGFSKCLKIADFGCAIGPNVFFMISGIIDTIYDLCGNDEKAPEIQIYLNDLPESDFNSIFKKVPSFSKKIIEAKGDKFKNCFITGVPGSFYGRLFPSKSLHFAHSSYSLHWLSQVPAGVENKKNVYMASTSPLEVFDAYWRQFKMDFTTFLKLRSEEIVNGGHLIITILGRSVADPRSKDCCALGELFSKSLLDMVFEGLVQEEDVATLNFPLYTPYKDEIKALVEEEGSFNIETVQVFESHWDTEEEFSDESYVFDKHRSGKNVANTIRVITDPMLVTHFRDLNIDMLFDKFAKYVAEYLSVEKTKNINISISLSKK